MDDKSCAERDLIGMYRAGAFAEKIAIPERNLIDVPDGMPSAHAALTEPGATGLHAVLLAEQVSHRPLSECSALVIGAGSVGLLTALILRDKGVGEIVVAETNPLRRELVSRHAIFSCLIRPTKPHRQASSIAYRRGGRIGRP